MTVENTNSKQIAQQMGTLSEYPFSLTVLLTDPTEEDAKKAIKAKVKQADGVEIDLTYGTDYSVSLNTDRSGGIVSVTDKRTSDDYITIYREYDETQEADYQDFNAAPADTYEQCFDKLTMLCQQQQEQIDRSVKVGMTSDISPEVVTQQVERIYQSIDNVDTVADNQSSVNTVADSIENVNAVSENIANVNKTGANINNVNTAAQNVTAINDCADNIEAIIDAPAQATIAADSAQSALSSKESALASASSAAQSEDNAQIWAEGTDEQVQALGGEHSSKGWADVSSGGGANTDLSNITDAGKEVIRENAIIAGDNRYLNKSQITNCLTEVPQRVKAGLTDNKYSTLLAGSVVIVPYGTSAPTMEIGDSLNGGEIVDISWDGSKLFYFVKYSQDIMETYLNDTFTAICYIANSDGATVHRYESIGHCYSGNTKPTSDGVHYYTWYDTENNTITRYTNTDTIDVTNGSLPYALIDLTKNVGATIKQVFNGFGFIGSTVWADKGIKGLAANGRNSDGSLKNIEFETEYVTTNTRTWTVSAGQTQYATITAEGTGISSWISTFYYEQDEAPSLQGHIVWLNTAENIMYWQNNDNVWTKVNLIKVFNINNTQTYTDGKIDNISEVKQVFRAADYSSHPQITETYSNGSSWYRVYSDGWCEQGGTSPSGGDRTVYLLKSYPNTNYTMAVAIGPCVASTTDNWYTPSEKATNYFKCSFFKTSGAVDWTARGYIS